MHNVSTTCMTLNTTTQIFTAVKAYTYVYGVTTEDTTLDI
jgi:hypothetical protein